MNRGKEEKYEISSGVQYLRLDEHKQTCGFEGEWAKKIVLEVRDGEV